MNKTITRLLFVSLCSLFMINCNTSKKTIDLNELKEKSTISLSKSSCFGKCEEYTLYVTKKLLVLNGVKNIESIGIHSRDFDKTNYKEVVSLFNNNKFDTMKDTYLSSLRDIQTITISYQSKTVKFHERNAPEELKKIVTGLENLVKSKSWKKN